MGLQLVQVSVKARDHEALGRFWAAALGWELSSEGPGVANVEPPGLDYPDPRTLWVDVVAVPDPGSVRYRAHLDLATTSSSHHAELVARLRALGATPADVGQGAVAWTVLADPEGNLFCVLEPRPGSSGTGPIAAVVLDCADPPGLAAFWGAATGWTVLEATAERARLRSAEGVGPFLVLLRTPAPQDARHRVHLDLRPGADDDQAAEVARLQALGAVEVDVGQGPAAPWRCLVDPEGNEFCVLTPR